MPSKPIEARPARPAIALARLKAAWIRLGVLLGRLTTPIILAAVYYLVLCPVGLLRRAAGPHPSFGAIDKARESYRVESAALRPEDMEKPF